MQTPGRDDPPARKGHDALKGAVASVLAIPVVIAGACLAVPYIFGLRWTKQLREIKFHQEMKARGRLIGWQDFLRRMRSAGGTCIEEKFSPKGIVRFWWTPENVRQESPHAIIDWFTMRKGGRYEPFVHWCRERYTSVESGSAILVETVGVPQRQIYTLWSECRSDAAIANWIEVAPPEIIPRQVHST